MEKINDNARAALILLGFNASKPSGTPTELTRIEGVPEMVAAINEFYARGGTFERGKKGAEMAPDENNGKGQIRFEKSGNYSNFKVLSHELGHYFGVDSRHSVSSFDSAKDYAAARAKGEAEAIYNEYKMLAAEAVATGSLHQPPELSYNLEIP